MKRLIYILFISLLIVSCQKAIEFDLPDVEQTLVIEATVESSKSSLNKSVLVNVN